MRAPSARLCALSTTTILLLTLAFDPVASQLGGGGGIGTVLRIRIQNGSVSGGNLASAGNSPIASSSAFHVDNHDSNTDSFIRYQWHPQTPAHWGSSEAQTSYSIEGTTHQIGDLLWFRQETTSGSGVTVSSGLFTPLLIKSSATIARVTMTTVGNACTGWGSAPTGFSAASAGSFTFQYYRQSGLTDDAPLTSRTYYFCADTTNKQVMLGPTATYAGTTRVYNWDALSIVGSLKTYQYEFLNPGETNGNKYCLVDFTGSGTSAKPNLVQCMFLPYSSQGSAGAKLYPMLDPPAKFPSGNQLAVSNVINFRLAGDHWDPYTTGLTNQI